MKYEGTLTRKEMITFLQYFYELEASKDTRMEISHTFGDQVIMTLIADDWYLLKASMDTGLLNHRGWSKRFRRIS